MNQRDNRGKLNPNFHLNKIQQKKNPAKRPKLQQQKNLNYP